MKNKRFGFTLLEVLLVMGMIAIIAGIVVVAINPARQLKLAHNSQRMSDLSQINDALDQYFINNFHFPTTIPTTTLKEVCDTGATPAPSGMACTDLVDLSELVPDYLAAIPSDPSGEVVAFLDKIIPKAYALTGGNGYKIMKDASEKIVLTAPNAELEAFIAIGTSTPTLAVSGCDVTASGATETTDGIYTIQTFNDDGTFDVNSEGCDVEVLVVAGGGGGGSFGGGGGAGGLNYNSAYSTTLQNYPVTVGAGGTGGTGDAIPGNNGGDSIFGTITVDGGGGGNSRDAVGNHLPGIDGGSGGGGSPGQSSSGPGGSGIAGQGYAGGTGGHEWGGGAGGGAGAVGANASGNNGGNGGVGLEYSISGSLVFYAGGGGGCAHVNTPGVGGNGGGGDGKITGQNGEDGEANTGGGGGGSGYGNIGGTGGSGVVIVRYIAI
jgi:prepilin-type N-terminal cleavage/methylation domain-containing protein